MKKSTLLAGLVVCITLLSCKKESSSSSSSQTVVKYQATTNKSSVGTYYTADRYNLAYFFTNGQWSITIPVTLPFSANLTILEGQGDTTTLSIYVNNSLVKSQTFTNPSLSDSTYTINYTIN